MAITTMVPEQVKTMKIQAEVQVLRPEELKSSDSVLGALKFSYICFRSVFCVFFVASLPPNLVCMASNKVLDPLVTAPGIIEVEVPSVFVVVHVVGLKEFPFSMTSHRAYCNLHAAIQSPPTILSLVLARPLIPNRLQLLEEFMLIEKRSKTYQRKDKDGLCDNLWEALNKKKLYYTQDLLFQEALDSQSTQTIKLPILQPGEYDLWKMRIEQYLQCIDYTLWKIVENGNAPIVKKTIDGKETVIPPTSVEEKAQRKA
ncbi:hypothetical protein Tco_0001075 [Tanacetum coccineum]